MAHFSSPHRSVHRSLSFAERRPTGVGKLLALVLALALAVPFVASGAPRAHAVQICESVIRDFPGGPGRRPGATVIPVFMRQTVLDEKGDYVFAISERQLADVRGDAMKFRLQVRNESAFDVGTVRLHHAYRTVREGPKLLAIADIAGGTYVQDDHMFVIEKIAAGQTVDLEYTLLIERPLEEEVSQSAITLDDFMVLDPASRFPQRYPETSYYRHRTTIEKVGIGGKEVSCFTGENADRFALPGQQNTAVSNSYRAPSRANPPTTIVPARVPLSASALTPEQIRDRLTVHKRVSGVARAGSMVTVTVTVENDTNATFEDILVNDRFDADLLMVENEGDGVTTSAGVQWLIQNLGPDETWSATYTARVNDRMNAGDRIPSTVSIFGEQLLDVPTSALSQSSDLMIAGEAYRAPQPVVTETPYTVALPQTGVEVGSALAVFVQILIGTIVAIAMYGMGVRFFWKRLV